MLWETLSDEPDSLSVVEVRARAHFIEMIDGDRQPGQKSRNPDHIWSWAVKRHGAERAILAWVIACDTAEITNPGGWFLRWVSAPGTWDLAPNVAKLRRTAAGTKGTASRPPAFTPPSEAAQGPAPEAAPPLPLDMRIPPAAKTAWEDFRRAWIAEKDEAGWISWFEKGGICVGLQGFRLQFAANSGFIRDWLVQQLGDVNLRAAHNAGLDGIDIMLRRKGQVH